MAIWENLDFTTFRAHPYGTHYGPAKSPVTCDVTIAIIAFIIAVLLIGVFISAIGNRKGQKLFCFIRSFIAVIIFGSIMLCNYGQSWETASLVTRTPYRVGLGAQINASLTVSIGLRSINITLTGIPEVQNLTKSTSETINYNERFSWDDYGWNQGQIGFGPYAGRFSREYRDGQFRGTPLPILWVASHFVDDDEGTRWRRFYIRAGYYAHIALWLAVPLWLLALILLSNVPSYGALYTILTGVDLVGACALYSWTRNPVTLTMHFEDGRLIFYWGWCYWLTLATGSICFLLGVTVYVADIHVPEEISIFFGGDVTNSLEESYASEVELACLQGQKGKPALAGRMTVLQNFPDCPPPTPNVPQEDDTRSLGTPSLLDQSFNIPSEEDGLDDHEDEQEMEDLWNDIVTVNTEYHQVFRKKSSGVAALTLLKQTAKLRQRLYSPRIRVSPHLHEQSVPADGQSENLGTAPSLITQSKSKCSTGETSIPRSDPDMLGHALGELYPFPGLSQGPPTISNAISSISIDCVSSRGAGPEHRLSLERTQGTSFGHRQSNWPL